MATDNKNNYIDIVHDQKQVQTMEDFRKFYKISGITTEKLFQDNLTAIFTAMSATDKLTYMQKEGLTGTVDDLQPSDLKYTMVLPRFCVIRVYYTNVLREDVIYITNALTDIEDYKAWADERLKEITEDSGYSANTVSDNYVKMAPNIRVAGWFKALEFLHADTVNSAAIVDISPFISYLTTNVTETGGNFTLSIPFVPSDPSVITAKNTNGVAYNQNILRPSGKDYYKTSFRHGNFHEFNYFDWLISPNDILFIRFERLDMETRNEYAGRESEIQLAGGVWDMIALVDSVTTNTDAAGMIIGVQVSGRDLMKLLIDDGSYFFSKAVQANVETMFPNVAGVDASARGDRNQDYLNITKAVDRVRSLGGEILPFQDYMWTVGTVLKKVITQLANIAIAPNDVFTPWGDRRTTLTEYETQVESGKDKVKNG